MTKTGSPYIYKSQKKIKGVILAAGYGTRFLPASKTLPKELFPLIDKPAIDFILKEMLDAGIKDILVITSRRKKVLEDYLDREIELEWILRDSPEKLEKIKPVDANFHFIRQKEMRGTGDALILAEPFVGNSPFVLAFPDDLVFSKESLSLQLINSYIQSGKNILAVKDLPGTDVSRYGVIKYEHKISEKIYDVQGIIEKPPRGEEPSSLVSFGRYLFTPEIFPALEKFKEKPRKGEFYHTEVINYLAESSRVFALDFEGERSDTGEPIGYLKTLLNYALKQKEIKEQVKNIIKEKAAEI